ncbi:MAG TPA: GntR family transcriptional regulator [Opitutaceae bacterium]|nr:GntR family transcriptional regulator [Opitutaceae bacterium]
MSDPVNQGPQARSLRTLRKWITDGKLAPGERLPTEHGLMDLLKVSRTTVRAALSQLETEGLIQNGENRRRIVAPLSQPINPMATTVALLTAPSSIPDAIQKRRKGPVWERFIQVGAAEALQQAGKNTLTLQVGEDIPSQLTQLTTAHPAGIAVLYEGLKHRPAWPVVESLAEKGMPTVVYGFGFNFPTFDTLASDHAAGSAALTRFLFKRGRKRILRVWTMETTVQPLAGWLSERDRGFESVHKEMGRTPLPALHVPLPMPEHFNEDTLTLRRRLLTGFLLEFFKAPQPIDAIMAISDSAFFPIAAACRQIGITPGQDIDLVGYDNNWSESIYRTWEPAVPLATVDKTNFRLGHELAELLLARAEGQLPPKKQHRLVQPELILSPI